MLPTPAIIPVLTVELREGHVQNPLRQGTKSQYNTPNLGHGRSAFRHYAAPSCAGAPQGTTYVQDRASPIVDVLEYIDGDLGLPRGRLLVVVVLLLVHIPDVVVIVAAAVPPTLLGLGQRRDDRDFVLVRGGLLAGALPVPPRPPTVLAKQGEGGLYLVKQVLLDGSATPSTSGGNSALEE